MRREEAGVAEIRRHSDTEWRYPRAVKSIRGTAKTEVEIGINTSGGGGDSLHHKRAEFVHDVKTITPYMGFTNQGRGKADA